MGQLFLGGFMIRLFIVTLCLCLIGEPTVAQNNTKLASVHKIYIGDLGNQEGSDIVREKIRIGLMKSNRFIIVETSETADAILTGVAGVERREKSSVYSDPSTGAVYGSGGTTLVGVGVLRLVDAKTQETIWVFEYKPGFWLNNPTGRVANKAVEQLLKDAKAADEKSKGKSVPKS
jgi:hypothetical protein